MRIVPAPGAAAAAGPTLQSTSDVSGLLHTVLDLINQRGVLGSWQLEARDAEIGRIVISPQTIATANSTTHHRFKTELLRTLSSHVRTRCGDNEPHPV